MRPVRDLRKLAFGAQEAIDRVTKSEQGNVERSECGVPAFGEPLRPCPPLVFGGMRTSSAASPF
jgi:hypothetical protein